jgi:hypothetical protein
MWIIQFWKKLLNTLRTRLSVVITLLQSCVRVYTKYHHHYHHHYPFFATVCFCHCPFPCYCFADTIYFNLSLSLLGKYVCDDSVILPQVVGLALWYTTTVLKWIINTVDIIITCITHTTYTHLSSRVYIFTKQDNYELLCVLCKILK